MMKAKKILSLPLLLTVTALTLIWAGVYGYGGKGAARGPAYAAPAAELNVGDYIDGFGGLKWRVIGKDENGILVRTDRAASSRQFSGRASFINSAVVNNGVQANRRLNYGTNYWRQAGIREYLNETFYNGFSAEEKKIIAEVPQKQALWWGDAAGENPDGAGGYVVNHTPVPDAEGSEAYTGYDNSPRLMLQNYDGDVFRCAINDRVFLPDVKQVFDTCSESTAGKDLRNANGDSYHIVLDAGGAEVNSWTRTPYAADPAGGSGVRYVAAYGWVSTDNAIAEKAITPALYIIPAAAFAASRASAEVFGEQAGYRVYSGISYPVDITYGVEGENGTLAASILDNPVISGETVYSGTYINFTATPSPYYRVKAWTLNGETVRGNTSKIFTLNVAEDSRVTVEFEYAARALSFGAPGGDGTVEAAVTGGNNPGGIFSPTDVLFGDAVTFTAIPDGHYRVKEWRVDGIPASGQTGITFALTVPEGASGLTVEVEFEEKEQIDIPEGGAEVSYNGLGQVPVFPGSPYYKVLADAETAVGTYYAAARLNDPLRYEWKNETGGDVPAGWYTEDKPAEWRIIKAYRNNTVFISGWAYGAPPQNPGTGALPDNAPVTYYYYGAGDVNFEEPLPGRPPDAGTYLVRAYIEESDGYYEFWSPAVSFTVSKAALTVRVLPATKETGKPNPEFELSVTGFVNGEDEDVIEGEFLIETPAGEDSPFGIYPVAVSAGSALAQNYNFVFVSGTLTVARAFLAKPWLTGNAPAFIYNGGTQGFDDSCFEGFDTEKMALTGNSAKGAGVYTAAVVILDTESFGWEGGGVFTFTWEIFRAELTVCAAPASRPFGTANPVFSPLFAGFLGGDGAGVVTGAFIFTTSAGRESGVGAYPVYAAAGNAYASDYYFVFGDGGLTVTQQLLNKPAASPASMVYNGFDRTLNMTGFVSAAMTAVSGGTGRDVGGYTAVIAIYDANYAWANGLETQEIPWTITRASLTVTAVSVSRPYLAANPVLSYTVAGLLGGDTAAVISGGFILSADADSASDAGRYTVTIISDRAAADNYNITLRNGTLTVTRIQLPRPVAYLDLVYNGGEQSPRMNSFNGERMTITRNTGVNAGTYAAALSIIDKVNFEWNNGSQSDYGMIWTIQKAVLTVKADDKAKLYNAANPALTYSVFGFFGGDNLSNSVTGGFVISTAAVTGSPIGVYPITVSAVGAASSNYTFSFVDGALSVMSSSLARPAAAETVFIYSGFTQTLALSGFYSDIMAVSGGAYRNAGGNYSAVITISDPNYSWAEGVDTVIIDGAGAVIINWSIVKAILTVTALDAERAYKSPDPVLGFSISGFLGGDTANVISGEFAFTVTAAADSPAGGLYYIEGLDGSATADNYCFNFVSGILNVVKAQITKPAGEIGGLVYNGSEQLPDFGPGSLYNPDGLYNIVSAGQINAGTYAALVTLLDTGNYEWTDGTAAAFSLAWSIEKAVLRVTANNASREYRSADPAFGYTVRGFMDGEGEGVITGSFALSTNAAFSSAAGGTYRIIAEIGGAYAANYYFTFEEGVFTILRAKITKPAITSAPFTYDGNPKSPAITLSALYTVTDNVRTGAGTHDAVVKLNDTANYEWSDGKTGDLYLSWEIIKAELTVRAADASRAYKTAEPEFGFIVSGLLGGDDEGVITGAFTAAATALFDSPVGQYDIEAGLGTAAADNYTFRFGNGTLTVVKARIAKPAATDTVLTYSGASQGPMITTSGLYTIGNNVQTDAGTYYITVGLSDKTNYEWADGTNASFELLWQIEKAELTVTAEGKSKTYNAAVPVFTYTVTGFLAEDTEINSLSGRFACSTAAQAASDIGEYAVTVSAGTAVSANYSFIYMPGVLTITPFELGKPTAVSDSLEYNGFTQSPALSGYIPSVMAVTGNTGKDVGGYTAAVTLLSKNYVWASGLTEEIIPWSITKTVLTVKADDTFKTYLDPNPVFDYVATGFKGSDTRSVISGGFEFSVGAGTSSDAGVYPIAVTVGDAFAANYTFAFDVSEGVLTVLRKQVTKPTASSAGLVYDATPKSPAIDKSDLIYTVTDNSAVSAGTYYAVVTLNKTLNYEWEDGTDGALSLLWRIAKAPLTVTANDAEREYRGANPVFTYAISGLADEDKDGGGIIKDGVITGGFALSTAAETGSPVGWYAITVSAGTAVSANYSLNFAAGTLTINKAVVAMPAVTGTLTYNANAQNPAIASSGLYTVSGNVQTDADTYYAAVTLNDTVNYEWSDKTADPLSLEWTIRRAELIVTADNKSRPYGEENPEFTSGVTGFKGGDNRSVITGAFGFSTEADEGSVPGEFPVAVSVGSAAAANYYFTFRQGTLTVVKARLAVPRVTATPVYNAGEQGPSITTNPLYTITGDRETAAGNYRATVTLIDTVSHEWDDGTVAPLSIEWTIHKASLTVAALGAERFYNAPDPVFGVSFDGFMPGDNAEKSITGGFFPETNADLLSPVGEYPITVSDYGVTSENYDFILMPGVLKIIRARAEVPGVTGELVYDANPKAAPFSASPLYTVTAKTQTFAGEYPAEVALNDTANYEWEGGGTAPLPLKWEIQKAALTVRADDQSRAYKADDPGFTYTVTGLMGNDTAAVITGGFILTATAVEDSGVGGVYYINIENDDAEADNYDFVFEAGILTVVKAGVGRPWVSGQLTYSADIQSPDIQSLDIDESDLYEITHNKQINAGTYSAVVTLRYPQNYEWADGYNGPIGLEWVILKANRADTVKINDWTYGGEPQSPKLAEEAEGAVVRYYYDISAAGGFTMTAAPVNAGDYCVRAVIEFGEDANYNSYTTAATVFTVRKAVLTVTAIDTQRPYGAENAFQYEISGYAGNDIEKTEREKADLIAGGFTVITGANISSPVGEYNFIFSGVSALAANYTFEFSEGTLTVIKAADILRPYLEIDLFVYNGLDRRPVLLDFYDNKVAVKQGGDSERNAGAYTITISIKDTENTAWLGGGDEDIVLIWEITRVKLTVTADNKYKTYDTANPALTFGIVGLLETDAFSSAVSGEFEIETPAAQKSGAGLYEIFIGAGSASSRNYEFIFITGTLTVVKAGVAKPSITSSDFIYDGSVKTPSIETSPLYEITGNTGTETGIYFATVTLLDPDNYTWRDGDSGHLSIEWRINKAFRANTVTISGWVCGETASNPSAGAVPDGAEVTYYYDVSADGSFTSSVRPSVPGIYYVRAEISESANYRALTTRPVSFMIAAVYTITYDGLFGTSHINPTEYTVWSPAIELSAPGNRNGYTFAGWYGNAGFEGEKATEIPSGSEGDITLWAKWELVFYTVVFLADGAFAAEEITVPAFSKLERLTDPVQKGYRFIGWYRGGEEWDFENDTVSGDMVLIARFVKTKENCGKNAAAFGSLLPFVPVLFLKRRKER